MKKRTVARALVAGLASLLLTGCASTPGMGSDPRDPFERYNRGMFAFNDALDRNVIKPVATGYVDYTPAFVRAGIGNFFGNLGDVWTSVNNYLQLKPREGSQDLARVIFNTTFGIVGLVDVATPMGLPKHEEDFGQTLGVWGVKPGPYVMLPVFGPSTMRDTFAKPLDLYADPVNQVSNTRVEYSLRATRLVDDRARLLPTTDMIEKVALDPYQFVRDAHFQQREARILDAQLEQ